MLLNDAESPVAEALPSSSTPSPPPSSPPAAPDRTEMMARRFEGAWRYGLAGEAMFERMVSPNAEWKAYNGEGGRGAKGVAERLKGMGEFYIDPTFSVTKVTPSGSGGGAGAEAWAVDWMFSGTWPLPWRPRVRVSGVARVETTDEGEIIRRVEDTWTAPKSLGAIVSSQLQPRFFDLLMRRVLVNFAIKVATIASVHFVGFSVPWLGFPYRGTHVFTTFLLPLVLSC